MVADTKRGYHEVARHGPLHGPTYNLASISYLDAIPFLITIRHYVGGPMLCIMITSTTYIAGIYSTIFESVGPVGNSTSASSEWASSMSCNWEASQTHIIFQDSNILVMV